MRPLQAVGLHPLQGLPRGAALQMQAHQRLMGGVIAGLKLQGLPQAGFCLIAAALHQAHMAEVVVGQRQLGPALGQGAVTLSRGLEPAEVLLEQPAVQLHQRLVRQQGTGLQGQRLGISTAAQHPQQAGQIHGHIGILRREAPRLIERLQGQLIALLLQRRDPQPKPALHHAGLGAHQLPKSLGGLRPLPTLQGPLPRLEQGFAAAGAAQ